MFFLLNPQAFEMNVYLMEHGPCSEQTYKMPYANHKVKTI